MAEELNFKELLGGRRKGEKVELNLPINKVVDSLLASCGKEKDFLNGVFRKKIAIREGNENGKTEIEILKDLKPKNVKNIRNN